MLTLKVKIITSINRIHHPVTHNQELERNNILYQIHSTYQSHNEHSPPADIGAGILPLHLGDVQPPPPNHDTAWLLPKTKLSTLVEKSVPKFWRLKPFITISPMPDHNHDPTWPCFHLATNPARRPGGLEPGIQPNDDAKWWYHELLWPGQFHHHQHTFILWSLRVYHYS